MLASRLLSYSLNRAAPVVTKAVPIATRPLARTLTTSFSKLGGHGPRKMQVQQSWTDSIFFDRKYFNWLHMCLAWWLFFATWQMLLGDSVYCDYDPELYSPDAYEHETGGFTRMLHKHFYQSMESELKAQAFDFIRTHNRLIMWQTCKDVYSLLDGVA